MYRIRLSYSVFVAVIVYAATQTLMWASIVGIFIELLLAILIFKGLTKTDEFDYDSLTGHLLMQYTAITEIELIQIIHIVMARVVSFSLLLLSPWCLIASIPTLILTMIHQIKKASD